MHDHLFHPVMNRTAGSNKASSFGSLSLSLCESLAILMIIRKLTGLGAQGFLLRWGFSLGKRSHRWLYFGDRRVLCSCNVSAKGLRKAGLILAACPLERTFYSLIVTWLNCGFSYDERSRPDSDWFSISMTDHQIASWLWYMFITQLKMKRTYYQCDDTLGSSGNDVIHMSHEFFSAPHTQVSTWDFSNGWPDRRLASVVLRPQKDHKAVLPPA